jgi:outer membrane protein W
MLKVVAVILAAAAVLPAGPAQALDFPTEKGRVMLAGSGSGYYNGGEWPELVWSMLTLLVTLVADEEDGGYYYDEGEEEWDLGFSAPKAQFGASVNYFVSSNLAIGARYIYRQDFRENAVSKLWGGGPELVYFFGNFRDPVRPFVSAGVLRTQAVNRLTGRRLEDGASVNLRGGLNIAMSNSIGLVLQTGYQTDRISSSPDESVVGKTFGIGIGLTASID